MGWFCRKGSNGNSDLAKRLATELRKNGLTNLSEGASRDELIEKGIAHVNELGDKCKLAIEILSSTETLEANQIMARETRNLAIATTLMAIFTLGLLIDAAVKNVREFQQEKQEKVLQQRSDNLSKAEANLHERMRSVTAQEAKAKAREEALAKREQSFKELPKTKMSGPHSTPAPKH